MNCFRDKCDKCYTYPLCVAMSTMSAMTAPCASPLDSQRAFRYSINREKMTEGEKP